MHQKQQNALMLHGRDVMFLCMNVRMFLVMKMSISYHGGVGILVLCVRGLSNVWGID